MHSGATAAVLGALVLLAPVASQGQLRSPSAVSSTANPIGAPWPADSGTAFDVALVDPAPTSRKAVSIRSGPLVGIVLPGADPLPPAPWWAPIASAIVPGSGQIVMRQRRGIPYLAAETFLIIQYLSMREDAREFRSEYQRLAQVARSFFSNEFPAGDFEYYERMEQFVASGAYDLDLNGALAPETDTTTFNGFTWRLARRTYWEDPDVEPPRDSDAYLRAVEFYQERAVRDEFRWSWQNAQLEQDLFRQTIQRSNSAFRRTSQYLAVVIANHALSAIDAFVMVRLSRGPAPSREYRIEATVPWAPLGRGEDPAIGHRRKE